MDWATNRSDNSQRIPLLTTKLQVPRTRTDIVLRSRLHERLDEGLQNKLTIISAPAGFGKTTLLSEWAQKRKQNTAWISLDEGDNTPSRFWAYVVGALQVLRPGLAGDAMELLYLQHSSSMERALTSVINDLASFSDEGVLVMDDYHVIEDEAIHSAVSFFIERMPSQFHVFITTRVDQPPLHLTRQRARGELLEIRTADLRFTSQETVSFLTAAMSEPLSTEEIADLAIRCEGWIFGLQLAVSSMMRRVEGEGGLRRGRGANRYITEYLTSEVINKQSESVRRFLLQTSMLRRMCGSLCDAVTASNNSQLMLEKLEDTNLFIVPLDDERQWYRYHYLFAEVLEERLKREEPSEVLEQHRRASEWYEGHGLIQEAINHLMASGEVERAVRLAERHAEAMLAAGNLETLLHWLKIIPEEYVSSRPLLAIAFAWALLLNGQMESVERYLEYCRNVVQPASGRGLADVRGHLATLEMFLASFRGEVRAQDVVGIPDTLLQQQSQAPGEPVTDALAMDASSHRFGVLEALPHVAQLQLRMGQLRNASRTYRQALEVASEQFYPSPAEAAAHIGMAELRYEWNELDHAMHEVTEGLRQGSADGDLTVMRDGYFLLSRIHQARGDLDGALDALDQAEEFLRKRESVDLSSGQLAAHRAAIWLAQGNLQAAIRWSQMWKVDWIEHPSEVDVTQLLTLARVLIAQYKGDQALPLLAPALDVAELKGMIDGLIRILVLQTLAFEQYGDADQAVSTLVRALVLAESEGYIRTFVNEWAPMIRLLRRIREGRQNGEPAIPKELSIEYLDQLLGALGVVIEVESKVGLRHGDQTSRLSSSAILLSPLSDREIEVLRLIAEGKSNASIAEELFISLSTVKTHINNLYSKLGVETRTQALIRAREIHLL